MTTTTTIEEGHLTALFESQKNKGFSTGFLSLVICEDDNTFMLAIDKHIKQYGETVNRTINSDIFRVVRGQHMFAT